MKRWLLALVIAGASMTLASAQSITCLVGEKAVPCSITIAVEGVSVTPPVVPPVVSFTEHEPVGMTKVSEWDFSGVPGYGPDVDYPIPGSNGWRIIYNVAPETRVGGWVVQESDATAPKSPNSVYNFVYPQGMVQGTAPSTLYKYVDGREMYVAFWWKPSEPFFESGAGNKIAFMFNGGGSTGQSYIILRHGVVDVSTYNGLGNTRNHPPNVNATPIVLGQWHRIEWYHNVDTGLLQWWVDGVMQGEYTDVFNAKSFDMFQFSPTFGGCCTEQKPWTDHYWFDHVYLSVR